MDLKSKKVIFFGTPDFTYDFLEKLKSEGFEITLVVTNPDRRSGRGMEIKMPKPKEWAIENNVPFLQPEKLDNDFVEKIKSLNPDLGVVIAYGKIMPESLINLPVYGTINAHYSLLPKYRGATPVESAILSGDQTTAVTIQKMRMKLDTGPVIAQKEVQINEKDTTPTLLSKLNKEALELLPETIVNIFEEKVVELEQDETLATHCKKIKKEDGEIKLDGDAIENNRKYRAYYGSIGTYFITKYRRENLRVKIKEAHLENGVFIPDKVVPENKNPMTYSEFEKMIKE